MMDDYRLWDNSASVEWDFPMHDEPMMDAPPIIGADERRMHVRAYEHWLSLLNGRNWPAITDLNAAAVGEFGPFSVLLDFTIDPRNPAITFLGRALREEGGVDGDVETIADVPTQSLLSRLTDHYDEVLENRAPVGFEAEFQNNKGRMTLYRGILMPYSTSDEAIDFVHGVINWKYSDESALPADVVAAVTTAFAGPARIAPDNDAEQVDWNGFGAEGEPEAPIAIDALLEQARAGAAEAREGEDRGRAALYRAISLAHDLASALDGDEDARATLFADAGLTVQDRAPMTPVIKLVFGADYDPKRITEYAAVLMHARRLCLGVGMVESWLAGFDGGVKGVVASERRERRPALKVDRAGLVRQRLRSAPALATVDVAAGEGEFVLLVARRQADGSMAIVAPAPAKARLIDQVLRAID